MASTISGGFCSDVKLDEANSIKTAMRADRDLTYTELQSSQLNAELALPILVGAASTYNPYRKGYREGGKETSSGEPYDPTAWTAAIQIDLRDQFGGVRYGRNYQPTYVLVDCAGKRAIVKINDVGPLIPGRIIDLNERSMRYCDPSMQIGVINDVTVVRLDGENWTPGPIGSEQPIYVAAAQPKAEISKYEPIDPEQPINTAVAQISDKDPASPPIGSEQPTRVAAKQYFVENRTSQPFDREQSTDVSNNIVTIQFSTEATKPESIDPEPPISVAAVPMSDGDPTAEPIGSEPPTDVAVAQSSVEVPAQVAAGSKQPTKVAATRSSAEGSVHEPINSEQLTKTAQVLTSESIGSGQTKAVAAAHRFSEVPIPRRIYGRDLTTVTAAQYQYPSNRTALIALLIGAIAILIKLPSRVPATACGTEPGSTRSRARSRRNGRQNSRRKSQQNDSRRTRRKSPEKSQRKTQPKTSKLRRSR